MSATAILTKREHEVLGFLLKAWANKRIATALNVATKTVDAHRYNVYRKLKVTCLADLLALAQTPLNVQTVDSRDSLMGQLARIEQKLDQVLVRQSTAGYSVDAAGSRAILVREFPKGCEPDQFF